MIPEAAVEAARDWMLECDTCGHRMEAVESLRGTGGEGLMVARELAAMVGWICEPESSRDTCPRCRPAK